MLVRIDYKVNGKDVIFSRTQDHTIRCVGSGAMVGQKIGDLLTDDFTVSGHEAEVKALTVTVMPDPEVLNGL